MDEIAADHTAAIIEAWDKRARGLATIAFCSSRQHGEYVYNGFKDHNVTAVFVDGNMAMAKRKAAIADYAEGRATVLVSVDLISEGFDVPATGCVIQARTTESLTLHFQQIGRGMRPKDDGSPMVLLDMAGNVRGGGKKALVLPTDIIEWTLEGRAITESDRAPSDEVNGYDVAPLGRTTR